MSSPRLVFGWKKSADPFEWILATPVGELSGIPQPALVPLLTDGDEESWPLDPDPALFLRFAELAPTKEGILTFAHRYGNLCETELNTLARPGQPASTARGSLMSTWRREISAMQLAVDLWDLLRREDAEGLRQYIRWEETVAGLEVRFHADSWVPDPGPPFRAETTPPVITSRTVHPGRLATITPGDIIRPGWFFVHDLTSAHLNLIRTSLTGTVVWDRGTSRPAIGLRADTLLAAVWALFAEAVHADRAFARCRGCGSWMESSTGDSRSDRAYCSSACRSRAYRGRQAEARRMHAGGKTVDEIAAELESDPATVRAWVSGTKGEAGPGAAGGDRPPRQPRSGHPE